MKTNFITICVILIALVISSTVSVSAQDFDVLLQAVDRIEANLKAMVDRESETRTKEVAELRELVQQNPAAAGPGEQARFAQLVLEVKTLRGDVDRLSTAQTNVGMTESDLLSLINDIEYLKSEMNLLRTTSGENKKLLASIDNEGFYVPPQENTEIKQLTRRLTELNEQLEKAVAGQGQFGSKVNTPSVKRGKITFAGYVHQQYVDGSDETSTFIAKRARLCVKGNINGYAQIKIEGDFAKSPKLTDGHLTISPHQQWSFCLGQQKPSFGTDFLTSSTATPFVDNSKAKSLGTGRDIGLSVSYRNKFNKNYNLKLTSGVFNGSGANTSDINNSKNFVARLETTLLGMFTFSPNIMVGKTNHIDSLKGDLVDLGSSLSWNWGHEIVEMEYIQSEHADLKRSGWYIWGAHMFSTGAKFLPELQLLARYEQLDPNVNLQDDRTDRVTLGTNLFIDNKYTKIQLNYQINTEQGVEIENNEFLMNFQLAF